MGLCESQTNLNARSEKHTESVSNVNPAIKIREISTGSTARVYLEQRNGNTYAVKQLLRRSGAAERQFSRECLALSQLKHANIVKLLDANEDELKIFQEFYSEGTLRDFVKLHPHLSEQKVRSFVRQLLSALDYMHSHNFVHRDVKLANIVMKDENQLVLVDFGQAEQVLPTALYRSVRGTPMYHAPECYLKRYRSGDDLKKVDVWMVGICMYYMMMVRFPWTSMPIQTEICKREPHISMECVCEYSGQCRGFLRRLLYKRLDGRPSARAALESAWMTSSPKKLETTEVSNDTIIAPVADLDDMQLSVHQEEMVLVAMQDECL